MPDRTAAARARPGRRLRRRPAQGLPRGGLRRGRGDDPGARRRQLRGARHRHHPGQAALRGRVAAPYLTAELEELPEEDPGDEAGALAEGVLRAFRAYQKRLAGARERSLSTGAELPDEPSVVSYLVAAAAVLDVPTKQRLLQAPDTASRPARRAETPSRGDRGDPSSAVVARGRT